MHKIAVSKFNEKIFKAYDIRGKYPEEINEDAAYKIARSYAMYLSLSVKSEKLEILVSSDDRPSSPVLKKAFTEGLLDEGVNVVDAGITTTPMHYFVVNKTNSDGGAMITASHLPTDFNGIKLSKKRAVSVGAGFGGEEIKNTALRGIFLNKGKRGTIVTKDFNGEYSDFFEEKFNLLKDFKIAINADLENSVVKIIFDDLIRRFPKFKISPKKYDLSISFDRDGDRIKFSDENGNEIAGDIITAVLVKYFSENTTPPFVYSINSSRIVKEEIEKFGATAVESRIGHSFVKKAMRENNAVFGGELSGHYYFKDFFYSDSALFAMFCMIDLLQKSKKTLSKLAAPLQRYFVTPELNFNVSNKDLYIDKAAVAFFDGTISYLDGIKVDYPDWWFLLRPSNTEDLIRLRIEANTPELLEEKKKFVFKSLALGVVHSQILQK